MRQKSTLNIFGPILMRRKSTCKRVRVKQSLTHVGLNTTQSGCNGDGGRTINQGNA